MKTTFAFLGKRNYKQVLDVFKKQFYSYDVDLIFLTNENIDDSRFKDDVINTTFYIFDEHATENEMIEFLFQNIQTEKLILVKESYTNINASDLSRMYNESFKKDVVISKQNKAQNFVKQIWSRVKAFLVKLVLGFNIYESEADIIALNNLAISIVRQSPNRSAMFCKLNTWSGIKISECLISAQGKFNSNIKSKIGIGLIVSSALLMLLIAGNIVISVLNVHFPFLALISYILVEVVLLLVSIMGLIKFLFYKRFGKINFINPAILVKTIEI